MALKSGVVLVDMLEETMAAIWKTLHLKSNCFLFPCEVQQNITSKLTHLCV
jgi:hypothetical protein